jgi:hypothetical protein
MAKKKAVTKDKLLKGRIAVGWNKKGQFWAWAEPDQSDGRMSEELQGVGGDELVFIAFLNVEAIQPPTKTIRVPTANLALPNLVYKKSKSAK